MKWINDNEFKGEDNVRRGKSYTEKMEYKGVPFVINIVTHTNDSGNIKKWATLEYDSSNEKMRDYVQKINDIAVMSEFYFDSDKTPFLWADTAYPKYDEYSLKEKVEEMIRTAHGQIRMLADFEIHLRDWISEQVKEFNEIMTVFKKFQIGNI